MGAIEDFDDKLLTDGSKRAAEPEVMWSPSKTGAEKMKAMIPQAEVYELDPKKVYVIVTRKEVLSMNDVDVMCKMLKAAGIKAVVMSHAAGPIKDGIQVMEQKR